ncbi:NAD-dependent epimerase/dehydratase family protein [Geminocystis herdmanii]|uniref:NAD-dependent epimerase/dehydratase family protein n=1 Tax=Geminocystis herdmanii TaxID=669359 RepID=UPI00034A6096|nr:NAD-dependent epimerase/dehydratase family protein [Geminocystis herdmanii]
MKILITGATGFIGSHLTKNLIKQGYDVKILASSAVRELNYQIIILKFLTRKPLEN